MPSRAALSMAENRSLTRKKDAHASQFFSRPQIVCNDYAFATIMQKYNDRRIGVKSFF
jgi:hypothetical protein